MFEHDLLGIPVVIDGTIETPYAVAKNSRNQVIRLACKDLDAFNALKETLNNMIGSKL